MKTLTLIPIAAFALCVTQAYASDDAGTSNAASHSNATMASESVGAPAGGSSGSGAPVGKTRAEVYQEFLRAKKDGTLDQLNAQYGGQ
ncbi:DUF4148 domain-containing protein [Paraburkholderia sp. BL10I2N1]|uniref:DUF4148 domain-containing protein n=1 Tax=Paraburkholderia sp. BL10I2N1 TaxID=1938796 RepID=UPI0010ED6C98|nr:DUF4148 domain-containing protein [Paraburkholderia sp. BL10I2N1]TDN61580.1 uncharacterized protein DUF4148 [Paraburkholderia sp. BL10I2N1]